MASETFVSAMMLITAVVACTILIVAVLPVVWTMVSTFSSASHDTDTRMRTDFKIVTTYANGTGTTGGWAKIWLKNIGTSRIGVAEIESSDVIINVMGNISRVQLNKISNWEPTNSNTWNYVLIESPVNNVWETGETLQIVIASPLFRNPTIKTVDFQFTLPNGVLRSSEFTTS